MLTPRGVRRINVRGCAKPGLGSFEEASHSLNRKRGGAGCSTARRSFSPSGLHRISRGARGPRPGCAPLVLIARLKLSQTQIIKIKKEILTTVAERVKSQEETERRDLTILLSLPGFGSLTVATALGESGEAFERRDYNSLRSHCGAAPVTKQSGGTRHVAMRQVCQPRLRVALHLAALRASRIDPKFGDLYLRAGRADNPSVAPLETSSIACCS